MSLLNKHPRQGDRYGYYYVGMDGYNQSVFSDFHSFGRRDFLSFDDRLDSVHSSKNGNGHSAVHDKTEVPKSFYMIIES